MKTTRMHARGASRGRTPNPGHSTRARAHQDPAGPSETSHPVAVGIDQRASPSVAAQPPPPPPSSGVATAVSPFTAAASRPQMPVHAPRSNHVSRTWGGRTGAHPPEDPTGASTTEHRDLQARIKVRFERRAVSFMCVPRLSRVPVCPVGAVLPHPSQLLETRNAVLAASKRAALKDSRDLKSVLDKAVASNNSRDAELSKYRALAHAVAPLQDALELAAAENVALRQHVTRVRENAAKMIQELQAALQREHDATQQAIASATAIAQENRALRRMLGLPPGATPPEQEAVQPTAAAAPTAKAAADPATSAVMREGQRLLHLVAHSGGGDGSCGDSAAAASQ